MKIPAIILIVSVLAGFAVMVFTFFNSDIVDAVENFKNLIISGSALAGAVTAMKGLEAWKAQNVWEDDNDLAKQCLKKLIAIDLHFQKFPNKPLKHEEYKDWASKLKTLGEDLRVLIFESMYFWGVDVIESHTEYQTALAKNLNNFTRATKSKGGEVELFDFPNDEYHKLMLLISNRLGRPS